MEPAFKRLVIDNETGECTLDGLNLNKEPLTYLKLEFKDGHFELYLSFELMSEKKANSLVDELAQKKVKEVFLIDGEKI